MMDAAPQYQEQQYQQEEDDALELEEKRIVIVSLPIRTLTWKTQTVADGFASSPVPRRPPLRSSSRVRAILWEMRCGFRL